MQGIGNRGWLAGMTLVVSLVIAGCGAPRGQVPVEDRGTMTRTPVAATNGTAVPGVPPITTDANGKPLGTLGHGEMWFHTDKC